MTANARARRRARPPRRSGRRRRDPRPGRARQALSDPHSPCRDSRLSQVTARVVNTLAVLRAAAGQRRVPYLSDEERHALRDERVRSIVRHAAETVPHYRDLFRAEGIDPREIRTAPDLERLPLLHRGEIQDAPERFLSESVPRGDALLFPTNGTTGTPLEVWHDRASVLENIALGERERVVESRLSGRRVRYRVLDVNYGPRDTGFGVLRFYREQTVDAAAARTAHDADHRPVRAGRRGRERAAAARAPGLRLVPRGVLPSGRGVRRGAAPARARALRKRHHDARRARGSSRSGSGSR